MGLLKAQGGGGEEQPVVLTLSGIVGWPLADDTQRNWKTQESISRPRMLPGEKDNQQFGPSF